MKKCHQGSANVTGVSEQGTRPNPESTPWRNHIGGTIKCHHSQVGWRDGWLVGLHIPVTSKLTSCHTEMNALRLHVETQRANTQHRICRKTSLAQQILDKVIGCILLLAKLHEILSYMYRRWLLEMHEQLLCQLRLCVLASQQISTDSIGQLTQ